MTIENGDNINNMNIKKETSNMRIGIGNDHSAVEMKNEIVKYLQELGHEVVNYGTDSTASCDYPEYVPAFYRERRFFG